MSAPGSRTKRGTPRAVRRSWVGCEALEMRHLLSGAIDLTLTAGQQFSGVVADFTSDTAPSLNGTTSASPAPAMASPASAADSGSGQTVVIQPAPGGYVSPPPAIQPGTFLAVINWGDGRTSEGTVVSLGNNEYQIAGRHTYWGPGQYTITASAGLTSTTVPPGSMMPQFIIPQFTFQGTARVSGPGVPEQLPAGITIEALPQQPGVTIDQYMNSLAKLSGLSPLDAIPQVEIRYLDGETVDYGFGAKNFQVVNTDWDGSGFTASAEGSYAEGGTYHIQVTFKSGDTVFGSVVVPITINQNPPGGLSINAVAGQTFSGPVETFTLGAGQELPSKTYVYWGDNDVTTSPGTLVDLGNGTYEIVASHTFAQPGEYRVFVHSEYADTTPPDAFSAPLQDRSTAYVAAADSQAGGGQQIVAAQSSLRSDGKPIALTEIAGASFTATVGSILGSIDGITAVIRWGDGTRSTATLQASGGSVVASGSHTYRRGGHYHAVTVFMRHGKVVGRVRETFIVARSAVVPLLSRRD